LRLAHARNGVAGIACPDVGAFAGDDNVRYAGLRGAAPGIGKTRLALEVAAELLDAFEDGVFLVEMALISDPDLLTDAIARTLGVKTEGAQPVEDALLKYLSERKMLLVLDNLEHLLDTAFAAI